MRHHPKSNNGVFSKKQRKASRHMMAMRGGRLPQQGTMLDIPDMTKRGGVLAAVLGAIGAMRRKAS